MARTALQFLQKQGYFCYSKLYIFFVIDGAKYAVRFLKNNIFIIVIFYFVVKNKRNFVGLFVANNCGQRMHFDMFVIGVSTNIHKKTVIFDILFYHPTRYLISLNLKIKSDSVFLNTKPKFNSDI